MFHIDVTLEDVRLIAVEHRVPFTGDDLKYVQDCNAERAKEGEHPMPLDRHDGTFDVTLVDNLTGFQARVNLEADELAEGLRVAISGDDYANVHIKSLKGKLAMLPSELSFIP